MISDLRNSAVKAHANFLVAMGVFNYIEILGSFYKYRQAYKIKGKKQTGMPRFDFAIKEFFDNSYYMEFLKIKRIIKKPPYDMFRSGMSHEYLVKTYKGSTGNSIYFTVVNPNTKEEYDKIVLREKCGIKLDKVGERKYIVVIFCPKIIEDFNLAIEEYKKRLLADEGSYQEYFVRRSKNINFALMNSV